MTFYTVTKPGGVKNEDFDLALDTLADMLVNSLFAESQIDKERQVVLEELIRGKNDPRRYAVELFFKNVWDDHPARNLPIGSRETLANSDRRVLVAFRDANFLASNMYTAVVGDQSHDVILEKVAAAFERMPNGAKPAYERAPLPSAKAQRIEDTVAGTQAQIALGLPAPGADHPDTYALDIMSVVLGEVGRRLVGEIRDKRGLASGVGSAYSTLSDVGCWYSIVGTSPGNVDQVLDLIVEQMRRIRSEPITGEILADAKSYIEGRAVLGLQTSIAFAQYLADREAIGVEPPLEEYLRRVSGVSVEDVQRVAQAYLDPDHATLVIMRPGETNGNGTALPADE